MDTSISGVDKKMGFFLSAWVNIPYLNIEDQLDLRSLQVGTKRLPPRREGTKFNKYQMQSEKCKNQNEVLNITA